MNCSLLYKREHNGIYDTAVWGMVSLHWLLSGTVQLGFGQLWCRQVALRSSRNPFLLQAVPGTTRAKNAEAGVFWNSTGVSKRALSASSTSSLHTNEQFVLQSVLSIPLCYEAQPQAAAGVNVADCRANVGSADLWECAVRGSQPSQLWGSRFRSN